MEQGWRQEGWEPAWAHSQCIQVELMGSNRKILNACAPPLGLRDYSLCTHSHRLCTNTQSLSLLSMSAMLIQEQPSSNRHLVLHLLHIILFTPCLLRPVYTLNHWTVLWLNSVAKWQLVMNHYAYPIFTICTAAFLNTISWDFATADIINELVFLVHWSISLPGRL